MFSWNEVYSSQTLKQHRTKQTGKRSRREAMDAKKSRTCVGKFSVQCGVEENTLGR